jgi:hypothetical protein
MFLCGNLKAHADSEALRLLGGLFDTTTNRACYRCMGNVAHSSPGGIQMSGFFNTGTVTNLRSIVQFSTGIAHAHGGVVPSGFNQHSVRFTRGEEIPA